MSRRRILRNRLVSNGRNSWTVDVELRPGGDIRISQIHGNICDPAGIRESVAALIRSKPRYLRAVAPR